MAYDPNWDPNKGKPTSQGVGGPLANALNERADFVESERAKMGGGGDTWDIEAGRATADVLGGLSQVFYGDQSHPGLIGGTRQVNPDAYWGISGDPYRNAANYYDQRQMPTMNGVPQNQSRLQQQNLIQMLQQQARGQGPSLAQGQLQQATDRNINQAASMAASQRGPGAAAGGYAAANMAAQANQQAASDSALLRMQEQLQAQGLLASVLGQTRGQDIGFAGQDVQSQLQAKQMNDQLVMKYMQMGFDADQANRQAALDMEKLKNEAYSGGEGGGGFLGGLFSALSDETAKTEIKPADKELAAFLDSLEPHSYRYKNAKNGQGRRISVMAQELEKSKLGEEFVFETAQGKAVDYGKGLGTMLAAQAMINKRLKKLEAKDAE